MVWTTLIILTIIPLSVFLIKYLIPKNNLGDWANISGIVGAIATAVSLAWGSYTYYDSVKLQRELSANSHYQEHMLLSMTYPMFSNGKLAPQYPPADSIRKTEEYERYRWYVGHALLSFESILAAQPNDKEWRNTFA